MEPEYVAEYIKRPLMTISCSDIGTDPVVVERNLIFIFKKARSWGVVLLIDEADVFMERRSTSDLNRNSLVAGEPSSPLNTKRGSIDVTCRISPSP